MNIKLNKLNLIFLIFTFSSIYLTGLIVYQDYGLNIDEDKRTEHQFKIKGPIKIRVYTRPEEKKDIEYSIKLSENGLLLGEYKINKYSDQESSFIETDYFHFTVPNGEHFYTLSSDEKVYIRLKNYLSFYSLNR